MSENIDKARTGWKYRAIQHTKANQTKVGALICAMLGYKLNPPCLGTNGCIILQNGGIMVNGWKRHDDPKSEGEVFIVGQTSWVRGEFNKIADELKFSDGERVELFTAFQKWILKDWRAKSGPL